MRHLSHGRSGRRLRRPRYDRPMSVAVPGSYWGMRSLAVLSVATLGESDQRSKPHFQKSCGWRSRYLVRLGIPEITSIMGGRQLLETPCTPRRNRTAVDHGFPREDANCIHTGCMVRSPPTNWRDAPERQGRKEWGKYITR